MAAPQLTEQEWNKIIEAVGILAGWRGGNGKPQAAVRAGEFDRAMQAVQQISLNMQSMSGRLEDLAAEIDAIKAQIGG